MALAVWDARYFGVPFEFLRGSESECACSPWGISGWWFLEEPRQTLHSTTNTMCDSYYGNYYGGRGYGCCGYGGLGYGYGGMGYGYGGLSCGYGCGFRRLGCGYGCGYGYGSRSLCGCGYGCGSGYGSGFGYY
nr:keratin-associated protein 6-1-like [Marmota flaviventris]